jgi:hypothetical protein
MADLSDRQKQFIVAQLAAYHSPSEVVDLYKEAFSEPITRQHVNLYNPETVGGKQVSHKWKDYFATCRTAFLNDRSSIAIAQQNFRLRALGELYDANKKKSVKMALLILQQAAKEEGGLFQRRVDEKGDDSNDTLPAEFDAAIDKIYKDKEVADVPAESPEPPASPVS